VSDKTIWDYPVTVKRYEVNEDGEKNLIWCNHAEAEQIENEETIAAGDRLITYVSKVQSCLKCGAYKYGHEDYWYEAPMEGVR
jgi:hypothetical protein